MAARRKEVQKLLRSGEAIISLTHFPHMGVGDFVHPSCVPGGPIAKSLFVPDEIINPHPRFATLTKNIRERRGRKVDINIPIFMDDFTRFFTFLISFLYIYIYLSVFEKMSDWRGRASFARLRLFGCHGVWNGVILCSM